MRPGHPVRVAGIILRCEHSAALTECLLVKGKRDTQYMLPGGDMEPGELARAALIRELRAELGIAATPYNSPALVAPARGRAGTTTVHLWFELGLISEDAVVTPNTNQIADWQWVQFDKVVDWLYPPEAERWYEALVAGPAGTTIYLEQTEHDEEGAK